MGPRALRACTPCHDALRFGSLHRVALAGHNLSGLPPCQALHPVHTVQIAGDKHSQENGGGVVG